VGGLAVVALIVGAVVFFLRRRRAKGVPVEARKEGSPAGSLKQGASVVVQAK
jgi:hypothetical protein